MDAKEAGNLVYLVGITRNELGGSHYALVNGLAGGAVPRVDVAAGRQVFKAVSTAIRDGLVRSCHDLSEGGLAVAAAEMAFAGNLGIQLNIEDVGPEDLPVAVALFSESPSRFLIEVRPASQKAFEALMEKGPVFAMPIGKVTTDKKFSVLGKDEVILSESLADLKEAWQKPLRW
jgi:phosphoribosylformylglycinamidine synthase